MAIDRSKQGTAFSGLDANDQTATQRARFPSTGTTYGASSKNVADIFTHAGKPTASDIMTAALARMANNTEVSAGNNPDFTLDFSHQQMTFQGGVDKFGSVALVADKPSLLGPNLSVPDMNAIPDDNSTVDATRAPVVPPTSDGTFSSYGDAGYGTSIDRNVPNFMPQGTVGGTFLKKRGAAVVSNTYTPRTAGEETLGEYLANDTYGYTE